MKTDDIVQYNYGVCGKLVVSQGRPTFVVRLVLNKMGAMPTQTAKLKMSREHCKNLHVKCVRRKIWTTSNFPDLHQWLPM